MNPSSNYDAAELKKFSDLSIHWWDEAGELKALHQLNPLRLGYIKSIINLKDKNIIDIGCGGGILAESLSEAGANVTGIDMSADVIEVAKLHQLASKTRVKYLLTDAESMATSHPNQFDMVTCMEMLEHVPDPASIINAAANLLKPNGLFFFSTINRNPKSYLYAILGAEYFLKLLPKNTHDYAKFIRPSELCAWLRTSTFIPKDIQGVSYNPLTQAFKMSKDLSVNYLGYGILA